MSPALLYAQSPHGADVQAKMLPASSAITAMQ